MSWFFMFFFCFVLRKEQKIVPLGFLFKVPPFWELIWLFFNETLVPQHTYDLRILSEMSKYLLWTSYIKGSFISDFNKKKKKSKPHLIIIFHALGQKWNIM